LGTLILRKIRQSRYAGDESFARDWARSRADARGYGPLRIKQELRARGVDESLISESLQECFGGGQESERARQALLKQFRREEFNEPENLRRATAFLQRRGYSETVIVELLRVPED